MEYRNLSRDCQPELGNKIPVCGILQAPRLRWKCDPNKKYSVLLIDINPWGRAHPDVGSSGRLWFVVDVPGCQVSAGKTILEYQAPTPLYGAGVSRYAFLVYEQPRYTINWKEEKYVEAT